ncbi:MAG: efflux RND transporter periplasmic adaptor subunit [candidate division Zixibacteria bacterium]|nr:efflux RND transporter periplasmic adaptor subunit [candidate division Zixibacteria bacterium]MBU1470814.1 efflux RND transporter periplasmic adaptor subunit [candidate division Zixibacteria bacterium]MBU2625193.1 efflux RND transporter periplasmic adaptor subunit [candidate division Zixibacteria bacterium]
MKQRFLAVTILMIAVLAIGCEDDGPDIDIESAVPVDVEDITLKPIREYVFATGTVLATEDAELKAEQGGFYRLNTNPRTGKPFAMGDAVKKGDVIVYLENQEFVNSVQFDSRKINFDISQREFEKQKTLYDKGGVTLRELTTAEQAFINSKYAYDNALLQLNKLKFAAPFDGILVDLSYYSLGQKVEVAADIGRVMNYSNLYSEVSLPGKEMSRIRVDQNVQVTNYAYPDDTLSGVVSQISPALDPDSRTFKVRVSISNADLLLRPGMFVRIDVVVAEKDSTVVIPKDIILDRRGARTVFVVEKGIAIERQIETGLANRTEIEVISGLKEDERLVVRGYETLQNRSRIKVVK